MKPYTENTQDELDKELGRRMRKATKEFPVQQEESAMKDVWKWIAGTAVTVCLVVGVAATIQAKDAENCAAQAEALAKSNAEKKLAKETADLKYAPVSRVQKLEGAVELINLKIDLLLKKEGIDPPKKPAPE